MYLPDRGGTSDSARRQGRLVDCRNFRPRHSIIEEADRSSFDRSFVDRQNRHLDPNEKSKSVAIVKPFREYLEEWESVMMMMQARVL